MDDDDDFTFPTVAVAAAREPMAPEGQQLGDTVPVPHLLLQLPSLPSPAAGASPTPLWPFAGSVPKTTTAPSSPSPVTADDEKTHVPVSGSSGRTERSSAVADDDDEEEDRRRVAADDEDRMDLLWEDTPTTTTTTRSIATAPALAEPRSVAGLHAGPPSPKQRAAAADVDDDKQRAAAADVDDDKQRAAALADAERMDKLWESFNEDLVVLRHRHRDRARRTKSAAGINIKVSRAAAASAGGPADDEGDDRWYLCNYSPSSGADDDESSDQETSASSPAEQRRGYGCAPTMLRASSRAGGAGQFCGGASPRSRRRRGGRGAAAGWALLLQLFRRLFAVDKTRRRSRRPADTAASTCRDHDRSLDFLICRFLRTYGKAITVPHFLSFLFSVKENIAR